MFKLKPPPCKNCITLPICLARISKYRSKILYYIKLANITLESHHQDFITFSTEKLISNLIVNCKLFENYCVKSSLNNSVTQNTIYKLHHENIQNTMKIFLPNIKIEFINPKSYER